ncbi:unnamed protein product, partial [marine sediment metagenome]
MREWFKDWRPNRKSLILVDHINSILDDYRKQGYILTVRQVYYQLVSRDLIPNTEKSYDGVINIVNRGRLAAFIDWAMIEDRARIPKSRSHWNSPSEILEAAADSYYKSRWETQADYVEVWCEKDAVSNIIQPVCHKFDVTFLANRGYLSQSALYAAAQRLIEKAN